jgi:hypothetical protein
MNSQSDTWINHQGMQINGSVPCVHSQHPVPDGVDSDGHPAVKQLAGTGLNRDCTFFIFSIEINCFF